MDITGSNCIKNIKEAPSPNCDERPLDILIDTIVLHATETDGVNEVIKHFCDVTSKVSSHYTIDRDGSIVQHVPETKRAWHCGKSLMQDGREAANDFSIGIELVNKNSGTDPYPDQQLSSLIALIKDIKTRYPITWIVTHAEIAVPFGRKTDPRSLNMDWVLSMINT